MKTMEIRVDESNANDLDVLGNSLHETSVNIYGSPVAGANAHSRRNEIRDEATGAEAVVLNRVVSALGLICMLFMNQNDKSFVLRSTDLNLFYFSQICSCKNTCCRKKTSKSEGCPCKNANLSCCENCKCGTKKAACKNKANRVVVNTNPSAFARHQEQQANAEREIKVSSSFP